MGDEATGTIRNRPTTQNGKLVQYRDFRVPAWTVRLSSLGWGANQNETTRQEVTIKKGL